MKLKIVFFGTPEFASRCLQYLLDHGVEVAAVVTQPDRPKGRSSQLAPSAVKEIAAGRLPVLQPEKASEPEFLQELVRLQADLFVVVAFGQILPQKLLDIPRLGAINVHTSLLPKYRGAAPMQRALMNGEKETGVAIQKIVQKLDAGDIIALAKVPIPIDMTHGELEARLLEVTQPLLLQVIQQYETGDIQLEPQNHSDATYAAKISSEEGEIDWNLPAQKIHNLIRALSPKPGAWVWTNQGKRLKILRSSLAQGTGTPGVILNSQGVVACGEGAIQLLEVQPEGKKPMKVSEWLRGLSDHSKIFINT